MSGSSSMKGIDKVIDVASENQAKRNAEKIKPIVESVLFCGRQGIALRGHRDHGEFDLNCAPVENEGNLRALLRLRVQANDKNIIEHFQNCGKNATYISWKIQNEILAASHRVIKEKIIAEVKDAKFFSILADETSDVSTMEQFSLCLRYLKRDAESKYTICEKFLEFVPVTSTTGEALANTIETVLRENNLDIENLRGQGYDGAASMSGSFKGTQARIAAKFPKALYVHCASHSLNLALSNSSGIRQIKNCFGIIEKLAVFFNTPKREAVLKKQINAHAPESTRQKLMKLCVTRWVERHDSVMVTGDLLIPAAAALEEIGEWDDRDSSSQANILLNAIRQPEFLIALSTSEKLLSYTLILSKQLQTIDSDLVSVIDHAENALAQIQSLRQNAEEDFHEIFEAASEKAAFLGTEIKIPRRVGKQVHRDNTPAGDVEEYFRRTVFIPFAESLSGSIEQRLMKHQEILKSFVCLLPKYYQQEVAKSKTKREIEKELEIGIKKLATTYESDVGASNIHVLTSELKLWHSSFKGSENLPRTAVDCLNQCKESVYPNVCTLLKIFATLPVTTCTAERSFSTLRRLKTYLRNTMTEIRLNGLASLNIHREIPVNFAEILAILKESPRRLEFVI
ncbi:52 kDa repressor of the inhibitor of the protein kinase-like [Photinus pyralis]|uniref:52 kDa repressor of the inhibitor of the protein kinase-like n=1 Tax=Photinus pyralis TaxID=7054 RepID=UPI0012675B30|nr:52 kDa repressor of the inhibitor of the protein kinase-like [Photinus pyralis]